MRGVFLPFFFFLFNSFIFKTPSLIVCCKFGFISKKITGGKMRTFNKSESSGLLSLSVLDFPFSLFL